MEEQVPLYDATGHPTGETVPRSVMRRDNLPHAATGVVVRDRLGRIYAHRRTATKDVYPSRWDFTAGGVLTVGEDPHQAAVRELAEELGVTGVELIPIDLAGPPQRRHYADEHTDYWGFLYTCEWDGEILLQPEEVAEGAWLTLDQLLSLIDDHPEGWMPDALGLLGDWLRDRHRDRQPLEGGWDSNTTLVEGRWIDRSPKRPEVAVALLTETRLLPRIAARLPLAVPLPQVLSTDPLTVRHRLVSGEPADRTLLTQKDGETVGRFLRALHDTPPEVYVDLGLRTTHWSTDAHGRTAWTRFAAEVLPLLDADNGDRDRARIFLDSFPHSTDRAVTHGDLGPCHLLVHEGPAGRAVHGIIDWGDAALLDPALDLAWVLWGGGQEGDDFSRGVAAAYQPTEQQLERALAWHRLGPWFEVLWGLDQADRAERERFIRSGLDGVISRLPS